MEGMRRKKEVGGRQVPESVQFKDKIFEYTAAMQKENDRCIRMYPETTELLSKWLDDLNIQSALNILREYAEKSGVSDRFNVPEKIYFDDENGPAMSYSADLNSLQINPRPLDEKLGKPELRTPEQIITTQALFVKMFFHELVHATGRVHVSDSSSVANGFAHYRADYQIGIESAIDTESAKNESSSVVLFTLLNEGITDNISHEVLLEYIQRHPYSADPILFKKESDTSIKDEVLTLDRDYDVARHVVLALTAAIAKETGVSEDVVWRGFVQQYYSGESDAQEFGSLLAETFGREIVDALSQAQTGADLKKLVFSNEKVNLHYVDTGQKWLDHLHISRGAH